MLIKKKYIAIAIISSFFTSSFAEKYNVVILKENKNYDSVEFVKEITYAKTGNTVCKNIMPLEDDIYYNTNFEQQHSECKEEYIGSDDSIAWKDIDDSVVSKIGTYLSDSCKNIKIFSNTSLDGNYPIINNGNIINVDCDMTTDNGGWMKVASLKGTYSLSSDYPEIENHNIEHTEMLYVDHGSFTDLALGSGGWKYEGMDIEKNIIKTGGVWRQKANSPRACLLTEETIPEENYRIIKNVETSCYFNQNNDLSHCGLVVAVKLPEGESLEGYSDVETVYDSCNFNNEYKMDYTLYVR